MVLPGFKLCWVFLEVFLGVILSVVLFGSKNQRTLALANLLAKKPPRWLLEKSVSVGPILPLAKILVSGTLPTKPVVFGL